VGLFPAELESALPAEEQQGAGLERMELEADSPVRAQALREAESPVRAQALREAESPVRAQALREQAAQLPVQAARALPAEAPWPGSEAAVPEARLSPVPGLGRHPAAPGSPRRRLTGTIATMATGSFSCGQDTALPQDPHDQIHEPGFAGNEYPFGAFPSPDVNSSAMGPRNPSTRPDGTSPQ
jgi:hypothetical protein